MGLVVSNANASFKDPDERLISFDQKSNFSYDMHSFVVEYFVKFDKDPNIGLGGNPTAPQSWRLGIVQNVLFQWYRFVYEDKSHVETTFEREFLAPEIDTVPGSKNLPFYGEPNPTENTLPGTEIIYSSAGYRENAQSGGNSILNLPSRFSLADQPGGAAPLMKDDLTLKRLERVLIFQTWLVAMKTGEFATNNPQLDDIRRMFIPKIVRELRTSFVPLASMSPFSTTFYADMDLANFKHSYSGATPNFTWGLYGSPGFAPTKKINRSIKKTGPAPVAKLDVGSGGRTPVTSGFSGAISPDEAWLSSIGLKLS